MSSKTNKNSFLKNGGPKQTADSNKRRIHQAEFEINAGAFTLENMVQTFNPSFISIVNHILFHKNSGVLRS